MESHSGWADRKHEPAKRANVVNLIRALLEREIVMPKEHALPFIGLALGEPTKANGYELPEVINESVISAVVAGTNNGYTPSSGTPAARQAIAKKFGNDDHQINPDHVFLSFGCSGALQNTISVLCEVGDKILVPRPGFPLFQCICQNLGVEWDFYRLDPTKDWEVDLADLESKIDSKTKAILVNNPSNPCGSCWTREHQEAILALAEKHKIPLICDEVYHGLSFDDAKPFNSFGNITSTVPVICCSAVSKIYCVPGWRLGWSIVYNHHGYFDKVIDHFGKQSMIILHPSSIVQAALPKILEEVPQSHFDGMKSKLKASAETAYERFSRIPGIVPVRSSAAMYMMVQIQIDHFADIEDDKDFVKKLLAEQNAFCFPSTCFFEKNMFRVVLCTRPETLVAFGDRLEAFCSAHAKK